MGALIRSALMPGLGQWSIGQPIQGTFFLVATVACVGGGVFFHNEYRTMYNEEYLPAVERFGVTSDEAESLYRQVNSRFKLSRGLLLTALGIWMYGMVDAYVDAAIRNATLEAESVRQNREAMEQLNVHLLPDGSAVLYHRRF